MSVLRLYTDAALTDQLSIDGAMTNPDEEASLDGTAGDTATDQLYAAVDQTTLSAGIDNSTTTIPLAAARFADTDYSVIIVGAEKMLITAGHGTTSLAVIRGYNGTTAASHSSSDPVRLAYNCSSITIDCADNTGSDESSYITYADDDGAGAPTGSYSAPYSIADIDYDESATFHRRVVIPASTPAAYKQDLVHRLACTVVETS